MTNIRSQKNSVCGAVPKRSILFMMMTKKAPEEIPGQPEKPTVLPHEDPTTIPGKIPEGPPRQEPVTPIIKPSEIPLPRPDEK